MFLLCYVFACLIAPVGMSWYRAWNDIYSVQTIRDWGFAENCNSFVTPGTLKKLLLSVYINLRDRLIIHWL